MRNTLDVSNPFQVTPPPAWWLHELDLFDPRLVIFPSQKRATFILARRATRSAGEMLHGVKGLAENPDTLIMANNKLVRVCEIMPGVVWDQRVFQKLAAHDIERQGGAAEVANKLDAMDAKRADTIQKDQENEVAARASDGYKALKYVSGERVSLTPTGKHGRGPHTPNRVSVHAKPSPPAPRIVLAT